MLRCPQRMNQHHKLFFYLKRFMDNYSTDLFLRILLLKKLKISLGILPSSQTIAFETRFNLLIWHQENIGWDQLLLDRFLHDWQEIAQGYIMTIPKNLRRKNLSGVT